MGKKQKANEPSPQNGQKNQSAEDISPGLKIVINKNNQLYDTLKDPKRVLYAGLLLIIFSVVLFIGLTSLSLAIKDRIPYKTVMSNEYGVFEMRNEKSDNFYFLFNTAELWGSSGIRVHEGQRLFIKASGIYNTELRHMTEKDSTIYWINANGRAVEKGPNSTRDRILKEHNTLLYESADPGCLLAIVIDNEKKLSQWQHYEIYYDRFIDNDSSIKAIKAIGANTDYIVPHDGTLLFAVNDIVFTENNRRIIKDLKDKTNCKEIDTLCSKIEKLENECKKYESMNNKENYAKTKHHLERMWYDDNVGSFLIVIERPRSQDNVD